MKIGNKPGQRVFQSKQGGDVFLVLSLADRMLYLYQTVETLLNPSVEVYNETQEKPHYWSETTGMMYILHEVSFCNWAHVENQDDAKFILENMEVYIQSL